MVRGGRQAPPSLGRAMRCDWRAFKGRLHHRRASAGNNDPLCAASAPSTAYQATFHLFVFHRSNGIYDKMLKWGYCCRFVVMRLLNVPRKPLCVMRFFFFHSRHINRQY